MKNKYYFKGKRQLDFFLSISALILLLPLLTIIAGIILISSGRPIIYRHKVVGRYGKPFTLLKFRTIFSVLFFVIFDPFSHHSTSSVEGGAGGGAVTVKVTMGP